MVSYRRVQYSVYRQAVGGIGDAGLHRHMIMEGDLSQSGLGVPAKSFVITNHGPGILYYQISSNGIDSGVVDGIDSGQGKGYEPTEKVAAAVIAVWSDNAATTYSLIATPGEWTDEELAEVMAGV